MKSCSSTLEDANEEPRRAVEEMLAFRHEYKVTLGGLKLTDLIHEGLFTA